MRPAKSKHQTTLMEALAALMTANGQADRAAGGRPVADYRLGEDLFGVSPCH